MGILDWLKDQTTQSQPGRTGRAVYLDYDFSFGSFQVASTNTPVDPPANARWYGPGVEVKVGTLTLPGGMVYVGQGLQSSMGWIEPSLIDPTLRVNRKNPDRSGQYVNYWAAYHSIPPTARGAYLNWLADGRRDPSIPVGYVLLFIYGLERRVLVDIAADTSLSTELPAIRAEMTVLLERYGSRHASLTSRATEFIGLIDLMSDDTTMDFTADPPPLRSPTWTVPMRLRIGLGQLAARRQPIPAGWALAWGWYDPEIRLQTAATRCPVQFARLFAIRYRETYGDGFVVRPGKRRITFHYRPGNFGLSGGTLHLDDIPDVFDLKGPERKLSFLFSQVNTELDLYSRWIGRYHGQAGRLAALARLPPVLVDDSFDAVKRFRSWANDQLSGEPSATVEGSAVIGTWLIASSGRLSKPESTLLARLLDHLGFGIEPDVRFGGPPLALDGPVVLFRLDESGSPDPTPAYVAATVLGHLVAAVIGADRTRTARDVPAVTARISTSLALSVGERARLAAHLAWLWPTGIKLTGLKKRLDVLDHHERTFIGDVLIDIATAHLAVSPAVVTMLLKVFRLLGLDQESVPSRLHASMTGQRSSHALVRAADAREPARDPGFALDPATIQQRWSDTEAVSDLLGSIFEESGDDRGRPFAPMVTPSDHEPTPSENGSAASHAPDNGTPNDLTFPGFDLAHSRLLHELLSRDVWMRADFNDLATRHHLMPEGALDVLNEAAFEAAEEPLIEGDDELRINRHAVQELVT